MVYWWDGFCSVEVPVSPNSQAYPVIIPVDASVKATVNGTGPEVGVYGEPGDWRSSPTVM